ncbi:hypothetical protein LTR95_000551 [Oleoguttula sp. CCFEE 5521]
MEDLDDAARSNAADALQAIPITLSATATHRPGLLRLPLEIRKKIYSLAIKPHYYSGQHHSRIINNDTRTIHVNFDESPEGVCNAVQALCLTSTILKLELLAYLFSIKALSISVHHAWDLAVFDAWIQTLAPANIALLRRLRYFTDMSALCRVGSTEQNKPAVVDLDLATRKVLYCRPDRSTSSFVPTATEGRLWDQVESVLHVLAHRVWRVLDEEQSAGKGKLSVAAFREVLRIFAEAAVREGRCDR